MGASSLLSPILCLPAFRSEDDCELNVIIEAPKGTRNKYALDERAGLFMLKSVLPAGFSFPFDFGFVPSTLGEDGDPIDVLVLMDEPAFPGCLVPSRLVGAIEAEQTERGTTKRNDRLIAVAAKSRDFKDINDLGDLPSNALEEVEHFFRSFNEVKGKLFKVIGRGGPEHALQLVRAGMQAAARKQLEK